MTNNIIIKSSLTAAVCLFSASALAQSGTITGQVFDETGEPVIGATVQVVGTNTGTITNSDGNFSIQASEKDNLQISFIGYISVTVKADAAKAEYDAWMKRLRAESFVKKYPMPDEVK